MGASAILVAHGPLRKRVAATLTDFVYRNGGRIRYHDQYVDPETQRYYTRLEWDLAGFAFPREAIGERFREAVGERFDMTWRVHFSDERPRMAIFVSTQPACLYDLLARAASAEWRVAVPLVVSNHPDLEPVARRFGVRFECFPIDAPNQRDQERRQLALLRDHGVELVVLARYMRIVGEELVAAYPHAMINIHHAFLPAFPGAKPYQAAYRRGVKLIGATSHYVTVELDAGPIIEQDVIRVSHEHTTADLVRLGRDVEKEVLARAVWLHLQRKVLVADGRTVIFR